MRKILLLLIFPLALAKAANPIVSYVQVNPPAGTQSGGFNTQTGTVASNLNLSYVTGLQCLRSVNGIIVGSGADCGTGGGGGGTNGTITASSQFQVPYYALSGTTTTLVGAPGFTTDGSSITVNAEVVKNLLYVNPVGTSAGFVSNGPMYLGSVTNTGVINSSGSITAGYNGNSMAINSANSLYLVPFSGQANIGSVANIPGFNGGIRLYTHALGSFTGNYVGFVSSNALSTSTQWVLPPGDGSAGQAIVTDGNKNLSFATVAGGGGGSGSGTVNSAARYAIPYYAVTGSSNVLSGSLITTNATGDISTGGGIYAGTNITVTPGVGTPGFISIGANGAGNIGIFAPMTMAGGYNMILPNVQGPANTYLNNDGAGNLSWATPSGGGSGSSALGINLNGVSVSSPTSQINFKGAGVSVTATGSTATVTIASGGYSIQPATVTITAPLGINASTITVSSIKSPVAVDQLGSGVVTSELDFTQSPFAGKGGYIEKKWYGDSGPNTFNNPLTIVSSAAATQSSLTLDGGGAVGINGLQVQTTFYVGGNMMIGSGATPSGASLAPTDGLYVKGKTLLTALTSPPFNTTVTSATVTGPGGLTVNYGAFLSTVTITSTVTVQAMTLNGVGKFSFQNFSDTTTYRVMGASQTLTVGHIALISADDVIADGGPPSIYASQPNFSVQYSSGVLFEGSNNFQYNGTSITVVSSITFNSGGASAQDNFTPGYVNIFKGDDGYIGQPLFVVGSTHGRSQMVVYEAQPTTFIDYGIEAGNVEIGSSVSPDLVYDWGHASGLNSLNLFDTTPSSGVTLQSAGMAGGGGPITIRANLLTEVTISSASGVIVASSETVNGALGTNGNLNISSGVLLSGVSGSGGQVFTSGGAGTIPSWTTITGAALASTQTWTGGNTHVSSTTFAGSVVISTNINVTTGVAFTQSYKAAVCQSGTASLGFSAFTSSSPAASCVISTSTVMGIASFVDTSSMSVQDHFTLPADWTGAVNANILWNSAATTNSVVWQIRTGCASSSSAAVTWNAFSTVTDAAISPASALNNAALTGITTSGCSAGNEMFFELLRDPTAGADTLGATANLVTLQLSIRRTLLL